MDLWLDADLVLGMLMVGKRAMVDDGFSRKAVMPVGATTSIWARDGTASNKHCVI